MREKHYNNQKLTFWIARKVRQKYIDAILRNKNRYGKKDNNNEMTPRREQERIENISKKEEIILEEMKKVLYEIVVHQLTYTMGIARTVKVIQELHLPVHLLRYVYRKIL